VSKIKSGSEVLGRDVNETLRSETETLGFQSETRPRPRPSHISPRPRHWENASRDHLETETSRPRLHPWCWGEWPVGH